MSKKKKKEKDKQAMYFVYVIVIIVLFIVFLLSARYFLPKKAEVQSYSYNGFVFTNITNLWFTEIQKSGTNKVYSVPLHYGPLELANVSIEGNVNSFKNETGLHITFDPTSGGFAYIALAASEISINLAQTFDITPIAACTINVTDACRDRPIVTCNETGLPAVYIKRGNETKVYVENNCIFVQGTDKEIVRAADRLLLKWFSVMP